MHLARRSASWRAAEASAAACSASTTSCPASSKAARAAASSVPSVLPPCVCVWASCVLTPVDDHHAGHQNRQVYEGFVVP